MSKEKKVKDPRRKLGKLEKREARAGYLFVNSPLHLIFPFSMIAIIRANTTIMGTSTMVCHR